MFWGGAPPVQEHPAKNLCAGGVEVCGQFQPCMSAQTNPTPDVALPQTLRLTLTPTLWGAQSFGGVRGSQGQSSGSAACFGGVFPKKKRAAQKAILGQ